MAGSKYDTHVLPNLKKILEMAKKGVTTTDIADKIGVGRSTFLRYIQKGKEGEEKYRELSDAFTRACAIPDDEVENSLYKKAVGYNARVIKHYKVRHIEYDDKGKKIKEWEELVPAEDEVHILADTQAEMFWLVNRRKEKWQYKPEGGGDEGGGVVMLPALRTDETKGAKENGAETEGDMEPAAETADIYGAGGI